MDGITFTAQIRFVKFGVSESSQNALFFLSGHHQGIAVHVQRVLFHQTDGNRSFGGKNRIFGFVHFGVVCPNHSIVDGVRDLDIVGGRSKFLELIEIQAVALDDFIVVINTGVFDTVALFNLGVVEAALAIDFIFLSRNRGRAVHIGVFGSGVVVQLLRIYDVIRVVDMYIALKLVLFWGHKVGAHLAGQHIGRVNYLTSRVVIGLLLFPIKIKRIGGQSHLSVRKVHFFPSLCEFGVPVVIHLPAVHFNGITLLQADISNGF